MHSLHDETNDNGRKMVDFAIGKDLAITGTWSHLPMLLLLILSFLLIFNFIFVLHTQDNGLILS
jgi:hypothetical protein